MHPGVAFCGPIGTTHAPILGHDGASGGEVAGGGASHDPDGKDHATSWKGGWGEPCNGGEHWSCSQYTFRCSWVGN